MAIPVSALVLPPALILSQATSPAVAVAVPASLPPWVGGGGSGGAGFVHNQVSPSASWSIPHSLGRMPGVDIYVAGVQVEADVSATASTVSVVFPVPYAGVAVLT